MTTQIINIPNWHPPKVNELLKSKWTAARLKKKCTDTIWKSCLEQRIVKAHTKRLVEIVITVKGRGRRPDEDAFYKATWDALVKCNMLLDDSGKWCAHAPTIVQSGKVKSTTIILTDIEELPPSPLLTAPPKPIVKTKKLGARCDA